MTFHGIPNHFAELYLMKVDTTPLLFEKNDLWLQVFLNISAPMGTWQAVDTCLTVNDVRRMIRWLEDLAIDSQEASPLLYFTEPNLSLMHINNRATGKTIRIDFNLELRPDDADASQPYFLTCRLLKQELAELADDLTYELDCVLNGSRNKNKTRHERRPNLEKKEVYTLYDADRLPLAVLR